MKIARMVDGRKRGEWQSSERREEREMTQGGGGGEGDGDEGDEGGGASSTTTKFAAAAGNTEHGPCRVELPFLASAMSSRHRRQHTANTSCSWSMASLLRCRRSHDVAFSGLVIVPSLKAQSQTSALIRFMDR